MYHHKIIIDNLKYEVIDTFLLNGNTMYLIKNENSNKTIKISPMDVNEVEENGLLSIVPNDGDYTIGIDNGTSMYKIYDYQEQKYLSSNAALGNIEWTDMYKKSFIMTKDTAMINMKLLEGVCEKSFLRMVECDMFGRDIL